MWWDLWGATPNYNFTKKEQYAESSRANQASASMGLINIPTETKTNAYNYNYSTQSTSTYAPVTTKKEMSNYAPTYTYSPIIQYESPNAEAATTVSPQLTPVQYDYIPITTPTSQTSSPNMSDTSSQKQDMTTLLLLGGGVLVLGYFLTKEGGKTIRATNPEVIAGKTIRTIRKPKAKTEKEKKGA